MTQAIARRISEIEPSGNGHAGQMTAIQVRSQVNLIQEVMRDVMQKGQHYGTIPGCGDKPTLLKPGAEKLGMTFRLAPSFTIQIDNMENGHREYRITCALTHIDSGKVLGEGVGSCSTMESKYRYRGGGRVCPDCGKPSIKRSKFPPRNAPKGTEAGWYCYAKIGGCGKEFSADDVAITGQSDQKADNPDIADTYNTVLKMAKKRAQVDAILTATAASDIFTQDIEDFLPESAQAIPSNPTQDQEPKAFLDAMFDALDAQGLDEKKQATAQAMARAKYKVKDLNELTETQWGKFLQAIREGKFNQVATEIPGESHPPQSAAGAPSSSGPTPAVGSDAAAPEVEPAPSNFDEFKACYDEAAMGWEVAPAEADKILGLKIVAIKKKGREKDIAPEHLTAWLKAAQSGALFGKGQ